MNENEKNDIIRGERELLRFARAEIKEAGLVLGELRTLEDFISAHKIRNKKLSEHVTKRINYYLNWQNENTEAVKKALERLQGLHTMRNF